MEMTARLGDLVVQVRDLRMRYGSKDVLDGVSFDIRRGEVITLLGPNGAGKTTTIEILEGFRMRSGGDVSVLGVDPATAGEDWRAQVGVVLDAVADPGQSAAGRVARNPGAANPHPEPLGPQYLFQPHRQRLGRR